MATVFLSSLISTISKGVPERHSPGSLARTEPVPQTPWTRWPVRAAGEQRGRSSPPYRIYGSGNMTTASGAKAPPPATRSDTGPTRRRAASKAAAAPLTSSASWKRDTRLPALHSPPLGRRAGSPPPRGNEWAPAYRACTHRRRRRAARWPAAASSSCG